MNGITPPHHSRRAGALPLAFEVSGDGPPVVILHGLFGSSYDWRVIARTLAPRHRVYCVDLRNHGSSPWAESMTYVEMAHDVQALLAKHYVFNPTVIGHSMGGKTAMAMALTDPASVGHLIVVDIAPVAYEDRLTHYVEAMLGLRTATLSSYEEARLRLTKVLSDSTVASFLSQNLVSQDDHFGWRLNLPAISAAIPTLSGFPEALRKRRYAGSTTLIHGCASDYVRPADIATFMKCFPAGRVHQIERAGHWVHADQPRAFLKTLNLALQEMPE